MERWSRTEQVMKLSEAEALARSQEVSERQQAAQLEVARTTLQYWRERQAAMEAPEAVVTFFASPEGLALLHRLVMGAQFVITLLGCGGVRLVCQFLELTGLSPFVAASYGVQQRLNVALEEAVVAYASAQREKLAADMKPRTITVCEDETFHPEVCLVGLEPVSNFILLERYAESRSAQAWTAALQAALDGLSVEVIQATSDEAKGLCRHVKTDLGAHHAPDVFHIQHDVSKATGLALAQRVKQAEQALAEAQAQLHQPSQAQRAYGEQPRRPPGRPPAFEQRIDQARNDRAVAEANFAQAQAQRTQAKELLHELSAAYHPYDLDSGQAQPPERVAQRLRACWDQLTQLADAADLPERCRQQLRKAQRVSHSLLATITFFFMTITAKVDALNLAPEIETALYRYLIPAIYLDRVADKTADTKYRQQLRSRVATLLAPLHAPDSPLAPLSTDERRLLERVSAECADLFQRSSSCVEGRNGQLALQHHSRHRLSDRKLAALTAVHNYFTQRPEGTTAAERFFGRRPDKLFDRIVEQVPLPGRPARKRPRPPKPPYLQPLAA